MMDMSPKYNGEPTAESLAGGLATLGRYGDSYMVHAAEGETVVPREILDSNPGLKQDLFRQMQMMGIEDPNRYVIGNSLNSINPVTGQPEFFFKKIWKAIKKVFKAVAPIAAPIIGNLIAPGIGGPIASALVSKLSGGSWGDALKSAALSYGTQALGAGISGAWNAPVGGGMEGFMSGLKSGAMAPFQAVGGMFGDVPGTNPFSQGIFGSGPSRSGIGALFPQYDPTGAMGVAGGQHSGAEYFTGGNRAQKIAAAQARVQNQPFTEGMGQDRLLASVRELGAGTSAPAEHLYGHLPAGAATAAETATKATPSLLGRLGKAVTSPDALGHVASAAIPSALAYALTPDEEKAGESHSPGSPQRAAYDQWKALIASGVAKTDPKAQQLKLQWYGSPQRTPEKLAASFQSGPSRMMDPKTFAANDTSSALKSALKDVFKRPPLLTAGGGAINGPGTGRSDSIPAMLSDGEFVMTAEAVRNAGAGSRDRGAARMYDMMARLERMA